MNNLPVFILGLSATGVATAYCFKNTHIKIFGADYQSEHPGFYSRRIKSFLTVNPEQSFERFISDIISISDKIETKAVLIPTTDQFVEICSLYRDILSEYFLLLLPEKSLIENIIDREIQFKLIQELGIKVPKFLTKSDLLFPENIFQLNFPVFIKPKNVIEWKKFFTKKGFCLNEMDELIEIFSRLKELEVDYIVQEIIEGDNSLHYEVNSLYLPDGKLYQHVIRKLRQYPDRFGTATCIEAIESEELINLSEKIIRGLKLWGFSNVEFKLNQYDKKFYYIETNPRVWLQINHSAKLGFNFPKMYYDFLTGSELYFNGSSKENGKWVDILPDLLFWKKNHKKYKLNFINLIKSWFPLYTPGILSISDPLPFLMEINAIKRVFLLIRKKK